MADPQLVAPQPKGLTKLAIGVGIGSIVEYYDIFVAAPAAAIVWPTVFFAWASPAIASALALLTFGSSYLLRPVGAVIFGHFGDKLGRRSMVLATMSIMGISMAGMGLDPSYASIGISSVVLLLTFRALTGVSLGGEFGGGVSWLVEHAAKSKWRAFWTLWAQPSTIGSALASFAFASVAAAFGPQLLTIGWRIPFLLGASLIVIAIVIRYTLEESPLFRSLYEKKLVEKSPVSAAVKQYWKQILLLALLFATIITAGGGLQAYYGTAYLVASGVTSSFASFSAGVGAAAGSIFLVVGAICGDKIGRKRTFLISLGGVLVAIIAYIPLLSSLNPAAIMAGQIFEQVTAAIGIAMSSVVFAEYFPTRVRYSASGLSYNFAQLISGVMITFVMPSIVASNGGVIRSAPFIIASVAILAIISLACGLKLRETSGDRMAL
jgi:MFS family permease